MQVQRIQHNNYNQTFGAKINIIGTNFGSSTMQQLSKKAEKIGTSEDVVEFIFSNFRTKGSVANFKIFAENYKAQFLPKGKIKSMHNVSGAASGIDVAFSKIKSDIINDYLDKVMLNDHFS